MEIEVLYLREAVRQAEKYGNKEPLIEYIESGNPLVLEDKYTRDLIIKFIRGEPFLSRGEKFQSKDKEEKNNRIIQNIYMLKGYGVPIKSIKKNGQQDALSLVGEKFHKNPEYIRKEIWGKREKRGTWELFESIGKSFKDEKKTIKELLSVF